MGDECSLVLQYFRLELLYLEKITKRRAVLGIGKSSSVNESTHDQGSLLCPLAAG